MTEIELVEDIIIMMREDAFHCTDEQARKIVDKYIQQFPFMLNHHNREWYYNNV